MSAIIAHPIVFAVREALPEVDEVQFSILCNSASTDDQVKTAAKAITDLTNVRKDVVNKNIKRYRFSPTDGKNRRSEALKLLFETAIKRDKEQRIFAAAKAEQPAWNRLKQRGYRFSVIELPKAVASILNDRVIKVALTIIFIYKAVSLGEIAYEATKKLIDCKIAPFVPPEAYLVCSYVTVACNCIEVLSLSLAISLIAIKGVFRLLPTIPRVTPFVQRIDPTDFPLVPIDDVRNFIIRHIIFFPRQICTETSEFMMSRIKVTEKKFADADKEEAYQIFLKASGSSSCVELEFNKFGFLVKPFQAAAAFLRMFRYKVLSISYARSLI